jgi:tetratricopeptide (TPR) repeat protein
VGDVSIDRRSRADLEAERDFLLASIEDLERERAAGDVGAADYEELRADYVARAATALRALESRGEVARGGGAAQRSRWRRTRRFLGRPRTRRALVATAVVCVLVVLALFAAELAGVRLPGESATGSVNVPRSARIRDDLAAAALLANAGREAEAVGLYEAVLALDPRQPVALADRGWLERLAGLAAHSKKTVAIGDASIASAVTVDPRDADAHAFYAIALAQDQHRVFPAARQIALMEQSHPSDALLAQYGSLLASIDEHAHVPVPHNLVAFGQGG